MVSFVFLPFVEFFGILNLLVFEEHGMLESELESSLPDIIEESESEELSKSGTMNFCFFRPNEKNIFFTCLQQAFFNFFENPFRLFFGSVLVF